MTAGMADHFREASENSRTVKGTRRDPKGKRGERIEASVTVRPTRSGAWLFVPLDARRRVMILLERDAAQELARALTDLTT